MKSCDNFSVQNICDFNRLSNCFVFRRIGKDNIAVLQAIFTIQLTVYKIGDTRFRTIQNGVVLN